MNSFNRTRAELEAHLTIQMEYLFQTMPYAHAFHEGQEITQHFYARHMIEAVIRIRLNNALDAYCLSKISYNNPSLAKLLLDYLAEEFDHDEFLIKDLEMLGVSRDEINNTEPMFSTQILMAYLHSSINKHGALPDILWNWFVEWYSSKYNIKITEKARDEFGINNVQGALTHLKIDTEKEHLDRMSSALACLVLTEADIDLARRYLTRFVSFVGMYLKELHETTIAHHK